MRRALWITLALMLILFPAKGETLREGINKQETLSDTLEETLKQLDFSQLPDAFAGLVGDEETLKEVLSKLARGEKVYDAQEILQNILSRLLQAFSLSVWRFARLLIPGILLGVMEKMRASFSHKQLGQLLEYACFLVLAGFMAKDLTEHMQLARENIAGMSRAMQSLFPLLLAMLSAVGGTAGAAFFQPAVTAAGGTVTRFVESVTFKLAMAYGILVILSHLGGKMHLKNLSSLFRQATTWTLGVAFTVFISVTSLQGLGAAVSDGISIRAAKYAVDNFVPVVGGMFADTMDTLVGSSLLIKNALGITGLISLLLLSAGPMLQTLAGCAVYKLSAALMESLAPQRLTHCIEDFSSVLTLLFVIQLSVGAMFFLLVAQLLAVGNLTVMLR